MLQNPAQGPDDFRTLDEYRREWICPCILGDLRTLMQAVSAVPDAQGGRPYGAGKFVAAGALFFACDHLGALFVQPPTDVNNQRLRFHGIYQALGGNYVRYQDILTMLGRNTILHDFWPDTIVRYDLGTMPGRRQPEYVHLGLGFGIQSDESDYRHFEVREFAKQFPNPQCQPREPLSSTAWSCDGPDERVTVVAIRLFINLQIFFKDLDRLFFEALDPRTYPHYQNLEVNFQALKAASVRRRIFPILPRIAESKLPYSSPFASWNRPSREFTEQIEAIRAQAASSRAKPPMDG